jgi:ribosomal protein L40E
MQRIEYIVQIRYDGTGNWEWEDAAQSCATERSGWAYLDELGAALAPAGLRLVKRVTLESILTRRCNAHPAFEADNCPGCGTSVNVATGRKDSGF